MTERNNIANQMFPEYIERVSDANAYCRLDMYPAEIVMCAGAMATIDVTAKVRKEPVLDDDALRNAVKAWFSAYLRVQP